MGRKQSQGSTWEGLKVIHPNAAGLDIGSAEIWATVPPDRTPSRCANSAPLRRICTPWPIG